MHPKIKRMVGSFPEVLILFLKYYKKTKNKNLKSYEIFFLTWQNIIFLHNIAEMHQYQSNIGDECMMPLYGKPVLDPSAPFDSPLLCL